MQLLHVAKLSQPARHLIRQARERSRLGAPQGVGHEQQQAKPAQPLFLGGRERSGRGVAFQQPLPKRRGVVAGYFIYAGLVALATIYGRYHYAVDAGAGIVIGLVARPLGGWLYTWQFPRRQAGWKVSAAGSEP